MSTFKDKLNEFLNTLPEDTAKGFKSFFKFNAPVITPAANAVDPTAPVAPELALEDGTVIKIDTPTLMEGSNVLVVTPEGELPAPDGTHKLITGEVIEVTGGKVKKLTPVEADPNAQKVGEEMAALTEKHNNLTGELAKANQIINALTKNFEAQAKEQEEINKALVEGMTKFSSDWEALMGTSTAKPIVETTNKFANAIDKKTTKLTSFKK